MQDTDLDIAAKAVYSLLCALAGDDHSVFPSRDKIVSWLNVGRNKYNAGMRQLRDQGYILVEQVKAPAAGLPITPIRLSATQKNLRAEI